MNKLKTVANLLLVVILSSVIPPGCSSTETEIKTGNTPVTGNRVFARGVGDADAEELVKGNNAFALDLYRELSKEDGNLFCSPYSISTVMAMVYAGARGETEKQMADTLGFTLPQSRLHPAFNNSDLDLNARAGQAGGNESFKLNTANALWGQQEFEFLPEYVETCNTNYDAEIRDLDFRGDPENSRTAINDWVSEKTNGRIEGLIKKGMIDDSTRLVLTNTIYFNATWLYPFKPEWTRQDTFYQLDGSPVDVEFMSGSEEYGYAEGPDYQTVELPYSDQDLAMVIILPAFGKFRDVENSLDDDRLNTMLDGIEYGGKFSLIMPKFDFTSDFSLKETLSEMGMPLVFSNNADLSGMDGSHDLFLDEVVHKAFVLVDEKGTEAAAGTGGMVAAGGPSNIVRINRPFIFLVRDKKTDAVLFAGRVLKPETANPGTAAPGRSKSLSFDSILRPFEINYVPAFRGKPLSADSARNITESVKTELAAAGLDPNTIQLASEVPYVFWTESGHKPVFTLKGLDFKSKEAAQAYFQSKQSVTAGNQPTSPKIGDNSFEWPGDSVEVGKSVWFVKNDMVICVQENLISGSAPLLSPQDLMAIAFLVLDEI